MSWHFAEKCQAVSLWQISKRCHPHRPHLPDMTVSSYKCNLNNISEMLIWYVNKTHKSNIYGGRRMPYPLPSTQDSNLVKPSVVRNYNKFLLLVCRKVKKKRQHCILAIERMSTHTSCLCFYSFDWLVCPFLPSYMCKLYIYMSASKYLVCERLQLLTVCLCVCVGVCVSLHACVTEPWLGLSGSDPSMAGIRIQGFSIPLCVCVCVSWREVGSRCSHGWHRATPSTSLPHSVWEHNGRSGKTIQAQEQGPL